MAMCQRIQQPGATSITIGFTVLLMLLNSIECNLNETWEGKHAKIHQILTMEI